jgi:hypothetical protein
MWRKRWVQILFVLLVLLAAGIAWVVYTVKQVRPFYTAALAIPQPKLKEGSREFLNRASRFKNDIVKPGEWQLLLTDEQINGWFAVDLASNHPDALPAEIRNPRVDIDPQQISFGVMVEREPFPVAASIDFTLKITGPRELMVRVITARIGNLPWSVDFIIAQIRSWAKDQGWTLRETTIDNDPVLLLSPPPPAEGKGDLTLETLELREGEIYLRGRTSSK